MFDEMTVEDMFANNPSMDDFFEEEALTPEQEARERAYLEQAARDEMVGEMYAARYSFD